MNEELKPNMCLIEFECTAQNGSSCVYGSNTIRCKFESPTGYCNSAVARVNAMVIELKKHGIDHQNRDLIKKIGDLLQESLGSGTGLKPVEDAMNMINEYLYSK